MTRELPPIEDHAAGETIEHIITAYESQSHENTKDLTNGEVHWSLLSYNREDVILDESASGVAASITAPGEGEVTVTLDRGATSELDGTYEQRLEIVDGGGRSQIYLGKFRVVDSGPHP